LLAWRLCLPLHKVCLAASGICYAADVSVATAVMAEADEVVEADVTLEAPTTEIGMW